MNVTSAYMTFKATPNKGKKLIIAMLLLLFLSLQLSLWRDEDTISHWLEISERNEGLKERNLRMRETNEQLSREIAALKGGNDIIEALAREELDMIKKDEIFFRFVNPHQ